MIPFQTAAFVIPATAGTYFLPKGERVAKTVSAGNLGVAAAISIANGSFSFLPKDAVYTGCSATNVANSVITIGSGSWTNLPVAGDLVQILSGTGVRAGIYTVASATTTTITVVGNITTGVAASSIALVHTITGSLFQITTATASTFDSILPGDVLKIDGTGATAGSYRVSLKVSGTEIRLDRSVSAGSTGTIGSLNVSTSTFASATFDGFLQNPARNELAPAVFGDQHRLSLALIQGVAGTVAAADKIEITDSAGTAVSTDPVEFLQVDTARAMYSAPGGSLGFPLARQHAICFKTSANVKYIVQHVKHG